MGKLKVDHSPVNKVFEAKEMTMAMAQGKAKGTPAPARSTTQMIGGRNKYIFPDAAVFIKLIEVDSKGHIRCIEYSDKTKEKYETLEYELNMFYDSSNPELRLQFEATKVGQYVACEHEGQISRGKIIEKDAKLRNIKVKNVDDFEILTIRESRIFKLTKEFFQVPNRVVLCKLYGLEMLIDIGTPYIRAALLELDILGKRLKVVDAGILEFGQTPVLRVLPYDDESEKGFECLSSKIIKWISNTVNPEKKIKMDGSESQVEISHCDKNGYIWLHFSDEIDLPYKIVEVTNEMTERLGRPLTEKNLDMLEQHQKNSGVVLAEHIGVFYRAKIINFTRNPEAEVTVQFVDFGNIGQVQLTRIIPIFDKESFYNKLPQIALKCHLNQVKYLSPKNVIAKMDEGSITFKISDITAPMADGHPREIELYGIQNGVKVHINHDLQMQENVWNDKVSQLVTVSLPHIHLTQPSVEKTLKKSQQKPEVLVDKLVKAQASQDKTLIRPNEAIKFRKWSSIELRAFSKSTKKIEPIIPPNEKFGEFIITCDGPSLDDMKFCGLKEYWGADKLADFEKSMRNFYEKNENIMSIEYLKDGSYYAGMAKFGSWFRVIFLNKTRNDEFVNVFLIDHARIGQIEVKNLRFLDYQFYSLPYQSCFGFLIDPDPSKVPTPTIYDFQHKFAGYKDSLVVEIVTRDLFPDISAEILGFKLRSWAKYLI